ncbi:endogenous retrovirus group K member 8 Gag polyprotein-like [Dasypus novemcinctus]|uniref:endogenous retrovirus group K member 8 Gag polyprotein-like n=1 Tax=Dasypus novemcinctus TaxID=9361 RepID=UPI00265D7316|nr:endogenous retrovirus group K member 8 Gag polyprotein-like [Dasypus novemcinctus]
MGASFSSRQAPQVRALAGLLACHHCKVSAKQLQIYWDLLVPFNPWLPTANLWDPDTYRLLIDRVSAAVEHEGKLFPPGLIPSLITIRSCLLGTVLPVSAFSCALQPSSDPPDAEADQDSASLVLQLNNLLEDQHARQGTLLPPKLQNNLSPAEHPPVPTNQNGELPPSSLQQKETFKDGELPPSSLSGREDLKDNGLLPPFSASARKPLYPSLPPSPLPHELQETAVAREPLPHPPPADAAAPITEVKVELHHPLPTSAITLPHSNHASPLPYTQYNPPPSQYPLTLPSSLSSGLSSGLAHNTASTPHPLTLPFDNPPPTLNPPPPPSLAFPPTTTPSPLQPAQLFPLSLQRTAQRPLPWYPYSRDEIKSLRQAVHDDGLGSPYAQQLLQDMSVNLNLPYDWQGIARAILTPGQFINWRAHFQDQAEQQVRANTANGLTFPIEAFLGTGAYSQPTAFAQASAVFWDQLRGIAMRAFGQCSAIKTDSFTKLIQGKDEDFSSFVSRAQEACARKVANEQAQEALARELILEGANPVCKQAIASKRDGTIRDWILACKDLDQNAHTLAASFASALALAMGPCFRCGREGHFPQAPKTLLWTVPITPEKPTRKLKIGGQWYTGTLDLGAEVSCMPAQLATKWQVLDGPSVVGATGTSASLQAMGPIEWKDEEGHSGTFRPLFLHALDQILWGRDILAASGPVLTTQPPQ